jgi:uncharacterized protein (DUF488 family)
LTVGHSTRPIEEFLQLLGENRVIRLIDVRTVPRSRHNPHFNREALAATLRTSGIAYAHFPDLGGLRHARPDSKNLGWRNASFRGFADHMQTPGFDAALDELLAAARGEPVAIMCAEAVPWRCHRSLIADALVARGARAVHILGPGRLQEHELTPFARLDGTSVTYPGDSA